jgi:hypothetical protein
MPRVFGLVIALVAAPALADSNDQTEYHFGFIAGAAVGEVGEREVQSRITGRLGKRAGTFNLLSHKLEAEFVPVQNFRLSLGSYLTHHHIAGVPGLDDRRSGRFDGVSVGLKYQLLDRAQAPFGLAIEAEPQWRRVDGASGTPIDEFGGQYWLMVDKELVPNRVLGVLNVVYEPEASRSRITGAWSHESTIRFAGAILAEAVPNFSWARRGDTCGLTRAWDSIVLPATRFILVPQCPQNCREDIGCWPPGISRSRVDPSKSRQPST